LVPGERMVGSEKRCRRVQLDVSSNALEKLKIHWSSTSSTFRSDVVIKKFLFMTHHNIYLSFYIYIKKTPFNAWCSIIEDPEEIIYRWVQATAPEELTIQISN
jgi:hypothetical protein